MEKLHIPVLPEKYLNRDRLYARLTEQTDVFFLTGREGCGKTSLLVQFCQSEDVAVIWYSFEKEDNNEEYFCSHFPYRSQETENGCRDAGRKDYSRIFELLEEQNVSYIVFDQLHLITNNRLLYAIRRLLENSTRKQKIFLAASDLPAPCLSKYFATGRYCMITDQEFCFSREELQQLTEVYFPLAHFEETEKCSNRILQLTGGWPVAVSYLLHHLQNGSGELSAVMEMQEWDVLMDTMLYDFIYYEIFGKFSAKEKMFLVQAAVFFRLDTELLQKCLGQSADFSILRSLRRKHLICMIKDSTGQKTAEQYQPLLRLFLLAQISQQQKEKLFRKAGSYYLQTKEFEEAFCYLKHDAEEIRKMLVQYGREMMQGGLLELTGQCLGLLKGVRREWREWMSQELGIAAEYYYRTDDREQMEACLNAADSMFGKENPYGTYRSLYRALFHYRENCGKYEKQVNNAIFFLRENGMELPFFLDREQKILDEILAEKKKVQCMHNGKKIRVSAFGTFRAVILEDGKELPWRTRKGCELFAYLLDRNGEAVERKTLLSELWREDMPNNAVAMLHNMFYNIRKELSYYNLESLIQYKNRKYDMDTGMIQSDIGQIRLAAGYVEKKDMKMLMQNRQLFDSWWGIYLEDMDNVWIRDRQEYYEKIFEKGCMMLGMEYMQQGDFESAVLYFKNALAVNCYSENIMRMLLKCYSQAGEPAKAKRQYEDFCSLLKRELDIEPGDELRVCYVKCMRG